MYYPQCIANDVDATWPPSVAYEPWSAVLKLQVIFNFSQRFLFFGKKERKKSRHLRGCERQTLTRTKNEVRFLLEQLAFERAILFLANIQVVKNAVQNEVWQRK